MSKILPAPYLSLFLLIFWLLLQNTVTPGLVLLGCILAVAIPLYTNRGRDFPAKIHKPLKAIEYFFLLLVDILISNLNIAAIILMPSRRIKPALIEYPLDIVGEVPITVLASTISLTPGTITAEIRRDGRALMIHALNVEDHEKLIASIKQRYEMRLKEIFKC
ncbi:multisubunit potassium/proton antiporter, PhaE subunit (TC 2.A.63.1.1) [Pseudidiomarina maritima]|jgi:multicomponent K+:H+ antiporter subunit E|uniref:Multisubunit potassium/proton antiporter, PhaE subunit (TC 2.A.63.1.1) n=1 Tax=Pseudidiomarina maritima TaxID=519453 RepID=A0A1I6I1C9_9GAMM|nr:Na+/H+ antiporter subunit E [Pseudidiomarina maritima]SFR60532.1 multisubunit potassium/proton antiporter, PhaE subunit (TC 2.A.63.1.1) [Pseudidiomarina maritima]